MDSAGSPTGGFSQAGTRRLPGYPGNQSNNTPQNHETHLTLLSRHNWPMCQGVNLRASRLAFSEIEVKVFSLFCIYAFSDTGPNACAPGVPGRILWLEMPRNEGKSSLWSSGHPCFDARSTDVRHPFLSVIKQGAMLFAGRWPGADPWLMFPCRIRPDFAALWTNALY